MTQEEQRLYIHYINKLWHISQDHRDSHTEEYLHNFLKDRKNHLQLEFIEKYKDQIELVEEPDDPNVYGIKIKGTDKDVCHILKEELKGAIE